MTRAPRDELPIATRAIVTGAAGSLGIWVVNGLRASGWHVVGLDSRAHADTVDVVCNLASPTEVRQALLAVNPKKATADVLINLAGRIHSEPAIALREGEFRTHDSSTWDSVVESNLSAVFFPSIEFAKDLLERRKRGVIFGISSVAALGHPGQVAYSAAKAGVEGMMLSLGKELAPVGIRAVAVSLGFVDTNSTKISLTPLQLRRYANATPTKRLVQADSLVETIRYVVASLDVNATVLRVDGGYRP